MAFLFQDQNQGIRNETARAKSAGVATVLFHPDFNRRLRNRTESADPFSQNEGKRRSRAWVVSTLTAGGDFHPALRTSAARYGRPDGNYGEWPGRQQAPSLWGLGMSPCRNRETRPGQNSGNGQSRQAPRSAAREFSAPDSHAANPIPVCSFVNNYDTRS